MAYARFAGNSDVYIFVTPLGLLECCGCSLGEGSEFTSAAAMVAHLEAHVVAGDRVPTEVVGELRRDDEENFPPAHVFEPDERGLCVAHWPGQRFECGFAVDASAHRDVV